MNDKSDLEDWQADEDVSARKLTGMSRAIRGGLPVTGGKGTRVYTSPNGGTAVVPAVPPPKPSPEFWARLTSEGTGADVGWYSWTRVNPVATPTGWEDASPPVTGVLNARDANGSRGLVNFRVFLKPNGNDEDGNPVYLFFWGADLMEVTLTQTGGSAGSKTAPCTFTYTVNSLLGGQIATGVAPTSARPAIGKMTAATHGIASYRQGNLRLLWIDEVPTRAACPE